MSINVDFRYRKPTEEIIRDLIWYSNGFRIPKDVINFGIPTSFEPSPFDPYKRDTHVELTGKIPGSKFFRGSTVVFYRRLQLSEMAVVVEASIIVTTFPFSTYDILNQINLRYGLMLTEADVEDTQYDSMTGPFTVTAKPGSLVWSGELDLEEIKFRGLDLLKSAELTGFKQIEDTLPLVITDSNLKGLNWKA